ncbi:MAG: hypothetical protein AB7K09_11285 [Planctomycetota bacterium]
MSSDSDRHDPSPPASPDQPASPSSPSSPSPPAPRAPALPPGGREPKQKPATPQLPPTAPPTDEVRASDSAFIFSDEPTSIRLPWVICTAVASELTLVRRALGNPKVTPHPEWPDFLVAQVGAHRINLGAIGMGRDASAHLSELFMPSPIAGALMIGFAGGLDPALPIGWLCLSQEVRSTLASKEWTCSRGLLTRGLAVLQQAGLPGGAGRVLTVDDVIHHPSGKASLHKRYGAHVVDMESAGFAAACRAAGVRWMCVRAVFDPANELLPPLQSLAEATGSGLAVELLRLLLTRPLTTLSLPRLAMRVSFIGKRLTQFLRGWFSDLPDTRVKMPKPGPEPLPWDSDAHLPNPLDF